MKQRDLIQILESKGYYLIRKSAHLVFSNQSLSVVVPHHKMVNKFTARKVLKQIGALI